MTRWTRPAAHTMARQRTDRSAAKLDALIEEAAVDAYDESEQTAGFYTMLEEHLATPFTTEAIGMEETVERIDMSDDEEIVARCVRGTFRQAIRLVELPLPNPAPKSSEWMDAYCGWACRR